MQAEAEVKYQIPVEKIAEIKQKLLKYGFVQESESHLIDIYIKIDKSELGGWNFARVRKYDDGKLFLTNKRWTGKSKESKVRQEEERTISEQELEELVRGKHGLVTLEKDRTEFQGQIEGRDTTIEIDKLHVGNKNYCFLECERLVSKEQSATTRQELAEWVRENIDNTLTEEAPSMLEFAMSFKN